MKITWEPEDIACGRIVCRPERAPQGVDGWTAKWTYKIGWIASGNPAGPSMSDFKGRMEEYKAARKDYCLVSMTDGMIGEPKTKAEIAAFLNENNMIPMPHEWLVETIEFLRDTYDIRKEVRIPKSST